VITVLLRTLVYGWHRSLWFIVQALDRDVKFRRMVHNTGIVVFVGPNGSGKSLAAVNAVLPVLAGETWECRAIDHAHNEPLLEHVRSCGVCDPRTIMEPARCRLMLWRGRLGLPATDAHVRRCGECEWFPGQLEGRCVEAEGIALRCGRGERLVYSTVPLLDDRGRPHERYRPCIDYRQLIGIEHADVVFDEVAGVSDSSDSSSVPTALTRWLQQLRKRDVRLRVTTPAYDRCSKPIRQVAQLVVDARCFLAEPATAGRMWRPRRAMLYRAYDAFSFDQFTMSAAARSVEKKGNLKVAARMAFWRPGCEAQRRYDTLAQVLALGDVTEAGMCMVCGGARSRPKCACPGGEPAEGAVHIVETVTSAGSRVRRAERLPDELQEHRHAAAG